VGDTDISHANIKRLVACVNRTVRDMIGDETIVCEEAKALIALRAALDAAEANINLKADWIEATINDMAQGEQDAAEARDVGVKPLEWVAGFAEEGPCWRAENPAQLGQKYVAFTPADKAEWDEKHAAAILSALHPASPLGAVAIAQDIAKLGDDLAYFPDLQKHGLHARAYEIAKRAQPTPAELLAAAAALPEVRALVGSLTRTKQSLGFCAAEFASLGGISFADEELIDERLVEANAALAPFARKGE